MGSRLASGANICRIFTHSRQVRKVHREIGHEGGRMFRALLRLIVVVVILVGAAAFFLGWWGGGHMRPATGTADRPAAAVGTSGHVDTEKARQVGAEVGEKTAIAASRAGEVLSDGALTAKIKSKMALD